MIIDDNTYNKVNIIICVIHTFPSPKIVQTAKLKNRNIYILLIKDQN